MPRVSDAGITLESLHSTDSTLPPSTSSQVSRSTPDSIHTPAEDPPPTEDEISRKPWKYIGYKGYSEFLASETDFCIFRKFDVLNTRIALSLQDELSVLEADLSYLDKAYSRRGAGDINNGSFRHDQEGRVELISKIYGKLEKYNNFMLQQSKMRAYPPAYHPDIKSLKAWHHNHGGCAIVSVEYDYLTHTSDLFCVVPKEKTPLRRFLDRSRAFRIHKFWRKVDPMLPSYDKDLVLSISDKRIDKFITCLILFIGTVMLIAPIWILKVTNDSTNKLVVITIFNVTFLAILSSVTVAKPFETLAATAAYAAVLMVFLQVGSS